MNPTDPKTPRTDAFYKGEKQSDDEIFSRQLETELTQAQAELKEIGERFDGLAKAHEAMIPHQVELRHERDAAVAELADVKPDRDRWEKLAREAAEARLAAQAEAAAMRAALGRAKFRAEQQLDYMEADGSCPEREVHAVELEIEDYSAALSTTAGKDLLEQLRQLSAEREHNANEALAMRAERDEARKEAKENESMAAAYAYDQGADDARSGVQEVVTHPEEEGLLSSEDEMKPAFRIRYYCDPGEREVGISGWSAWVLASDQTGTILADVVAERDAANALVDRLAGALEAAGRLVRGKYTAWHYAGGVDDCAHGYSAGIPCPKCDAATLEAALAEVAKSLSPRTTENTKPQ